MQRHGGGMQGLFEQVPGVLGARTGPGRLTLSARCFCR
jgi:hypothetical protein